MRIYAYSVVFTAVALLALPALAQNVPQFATTSSTSKSSRNSTNSVQKSNAELAKELGLSEIPELTNATDGAGEILDADKDGVADSKDKEIAIPNPFAPQEIKEEDKPKKKRVYKARPQVELRRTIADPRIDDGYVQGLISQRANEQYNK